MVCWSTKAAISLKRVQIEENLLWGTYRKLGTHQRSFQRHHPRPPIASPSPRLGFAPHPKRQSLLSQERVKLQSANLARTITGSIRTKAHEIFMMENYCEKEALAYPGTAQFVGVPPIISGTGKATDFKYCEYIQRVHPNKSS